MTLAHDMHMTLAHDMHMTLAHDMHMTLAHDMHMNKCLPLQIPVLKCELVEQCTSHSAHLM